MCYADRTNISLAIVEMERELGFSESEDGVVFSSFFIGCTHEQHTPAVLHSSVLLQPLEKSPPPLIPFFIGCTHEHTAVLQPPRRKLSTVQKTLSHPPLIPFADPRPAAADRHLHAAPRRLPRRALWRQGRPRLRAQIPLAAPCAKPPTPSSCLHGPVYTGCAQAVFWWSLWTMATPIAASTSIPVLVAARVALGLGEGMSLPVNPHEHSNDDF